MNIEIYYPYELVPRIPNDLSLLVLDMFRKGYYYFNNSLYHDKKKMITAKKKHDKAVRIYERIFSISRVTQRKNRVIVYSSIVSPKKMEKVEKRIAEYFRRAKIAVEGDSLTFPWAPRVNDRRSSFRYPNYRCHWCGGLVSKADKRFCSGKCASNYYGNFDWQTIRWRILARDNYTCVICKAKGESNELECDHLLAICNGGDKFSDDNLRTLCKKCHKDKTRKDLEVKRKREEKINKNQEGNSSKSVLKIISFM